MAERQRPLSQTHDSARRSLPPLRGGGKDGYQAESVPGGEEPPSVPGQTPAGALQEPRRTGQPQTFHRLHHRCKFLSPTTSQKKQMAFCDNLKQKVLNFFKTSV